MENRRKRRFHLLCNAHLDPVWQWDWQEGLGAALSTFRVAADFCEEFDRFVFCHNESLLYEWVEEYEPALFERIRRLVKQGKWHIMGGWYLQPDCNLPAGESIVRQIAKGNRYFMEKFGVRPTVAVSMDCFGHSKGLVQILEQAGYEGYLFMRPDIDTNGVTDIPQTFRWEGYNGSRVKGFRLNASYNTPYGIAGQAIRDYAKYNTSPDDILRCWGIGDHGGGPSRQDILDVNRVIDEDEENEILHSTPEAFFAPLEVEALPPFTRELGPIDVGAYTTMHGVKRLHRRLENRLAAAEKLGVACELGGLLAYPAERLEEAWTDLLFTEFHDILPGTSVKPAEEHAIQKLYHGLEIAEGLLTRSLYAMAADEAPAAEGEIPLFVANPHPYPITDTFECEYMLADQNWSGRYMAADVYSGGERVPSQMEKENSTINLDWRKKVVVHAALKPLSITRFDCKMVPLDEKPSAVADMTGETVRVVEAGRLCLTMDTRRGCFTSLMVDGVEYGGDGLGRLKVYRDNFDPWLLEGRAIDEYLEDFTLLDEEESARFGGSLGETLSPARIIEDGEVRTCVEVLLGYRTSRAKLVYKLSKQHPAIEVDISIQWNEKDRLVRFLVPHNLPAPRLTGQDMAGVKPLSTAYEMVAQKWVMASDRTAGRAVSVINDGTYGSKLNEDGIEVSLLRAPSYTCFHLEQNPPTPPDRSLPRIDRGENAFRLTILAGAPDDIEENTDRAAQYKNEEPVAVSYFPGGTGRRASGLFTVDGARLDACKKSWDGEAYILRLFNPLERRSDARVRIDALGVDETLSLGPLEIRTLRVERGRCRPAHLIDETPLSATEG